MANTIRHKRGTTTPAASSLVTGELAVNTATGAVYTKTDAGSVVSVGGVTLSDLGNGSATAGALVLDALKYANAPSSTNQLATEGDVNSAVNAYAASVSGNMAAIADTNAPTSGTKFNSPKAALNMLMFPGYQEFFGGGATGTSGTNAGAPSTSVRLRQFSSPNASTAGYATFVFDTNSSSTGFYGSGRGLGDFRKNFARKFWVSGRSIIGSDAGFGGDANNLYRVELGGRTTLGVTGDPTTQGIGWKVVGGGSQAITFYLRTRTTVNGGAYYSATSTFSPVANQWFDWLIYYDGSANAYLYVNDVQVATIAASFTGYQEGYGHYTEQIEQTASAATRMIAQQLPPRVFFAE